MKRMLMIIGFLISCSAFSQNILTIDTCYANMKRNSPLNNNIGLISKAIDLKIKTLNSNYFPQLNIGGQASWQSDVTMLEIESSMFNFETPEISKDQYKLYAEISQIIWDGGFTSTTKNIEMISSQIDSSNIEFNIYKLEEQLNTLYFNILSIQEQINILELSKASVTDRIREVEKLVQNDIIIQENLDELNVKKLELQQQIDKAYSGLGSFEGMLEILTGEEIPEFTKYLLPTSDYLAPKSITDFNEWQRPELENLSLLQKQMHAKSNLLSKSNMPVFSAFGQAGYGRPGLNMLSDEFQEYAILGVRVRWTPWDWNKTRNKREILNLNIEQIENSKSALIQAYSMEAQKSLDDIKLYDNLILQDAKIINLRESITKSRESGLRNAVITSAYYLDALNSESKAKVQLELHRIAKSKAMLEFHRITGVN